MASRVRRASGSVAYSRCETQLPHAGEPWFGLEAGASINATETPNGSSDEAQRRPHHVLTRTTGVVTNPLLLPHCAEKQADGSGHRQRRHGPVFHLLLDVGLELLDCLLRLLAILLRLL